MASDNDTRLNKAENHSQQPQAPVKGFSRLPLELRIEIWKLVWSSMARNLGPCLGRCPFLWTIHVMPQYPWLRATMNFDEVKVVAEPMQGKYIGGRGAPIGLLSQINQESRQFTLSKGFIPISATQHWYWDYRDRPNRRRLVRIPQSNTVFWVNPECDQFAVVYQQSHKGITCRFDHKWDGTIDNPWLRTCPVALTAPISARPSRVMSLSFLGFLVVPILWIKSEREGAIKMLANLPCLEEISVIAEINGMKKDLGTDWTSVFSTSGWVCRSPNFYPPWQIQKLDDAQTFQVTLAASPAEIETSVRSGLGIWDLPPFMSPPNDCQSRLIEVLQFLGSNGVRRANIVGRPAHLPMVEWWQQNQL
ncbi:hypothetical protein DL769_003596 [Monosporascus sp. CRB-8-3]|nr:hypothetical protein DL769_003596 [Monosporascus sp. CRB-8-3]